MTPHQHPFRDYRAVMICTRRPLSRILGTDAARIAEMKPQDRSAETRRKRMRAGDPILNN